MKHLFFQPSVAEDPSGATDCTTQWNKNQNLLYCLYNCIHYTTHFSYSSFGKSRVGDKVWLVAAAQ